MNWIAEEIKKQRIGTVKHNRTNIPGTDGWEFIHPDMPMPLGIIHLRWVGKGTLDILYVFVMERYRRAGIATKMLEAVVKHHRDEVKMVITGGANRYSKPWLLSMKFEPDRSLGWMRVIPPETPKKKGKK